MFIHVDSNSSIPIYMQIINQVKDSVASGLLFPGDRLPSVRELSSNLGINHNTIARCYQELEREGIIETRHGIGAFVTAGISKISEEERVKRIRVKIKELLTESYHLQFTKNDIERLLAQEFASWPRGGGESE